MRVISGKYRAKKLLAPEGINTRPTTDRVKEALFGTIQFSVPRAKVLDLFAGSGALGIEALSRGANECTFVESDVKSLEILKQNLVGIDAEYKIIPRDYQLALESLKGQVFDIILLDPPYEAGFYDSAITTIKQNDMLAKDGLLVLEIKTGMQSGALAHFTQKKTKTYGKITLEYYERGN